MLLLRQFSQKWPRLKSDNAPNLVALISVFIRMTFQRDKLVDDLYFTWKKCGSVSANQPALLVKRLQS
jgi:hypothetical protein